MVSMNKITNVLIISTLIALIVMICVMIFASEKISVKTLAWALGIGFAINSISWFLKIGDISRSGGVGMPMIYPQQYQQPVYESQQ